MCIRDSANRAPIYSDERYRRELELINKRKQDAIEKRQAQLREEEEKLAQELEEKAITKKGANLDMDKFVSKYERSVKEWQIRSCKQTVIEALLVVTILSPRNLIQYLGGSSTK